MVGSDKNCKIRSAPCGCQLDAAFAWRVNGSKRSSRAAFSLAAGLPWLHLLEGKSTLWERRSTSSCVCLFPLGNFFLVCCDKASGDRWPDEEILLPEWEFDYRRIEVNPRGVYFG